MVSLNKDQLSVMMEAGFILMGMQRFKEAKEVFEGLAVLEPKSEIPFVALGGVSFCEGKLSEAIKLYQKALTLTPDSLYAKAYLGESLFFSGKKKEAVQLLKEADEEDPKGSVGDFARALLDAMHRGFTPEKLSQKKEIEDYYAKKGRKL